MFAGGCQVLLGIFVLDRPENGVYSNEVYMGGTKMKPTLTEEIRGMGYRMTAIASQSRIDPVYGVFHEANLITGEKGALDDVCGNFIGEETEDREFLIH